MVAPVVKTGVDIDVGIYVVVEQRAVRRGQPDLDEGVVQQAVLQSHLLQTARRRRGRGRRGGRHRLAAAEQLQFERDARAPVGRVDADVAALHRHR